MEELNLFLQPKEEVAVLPIENKTLLTADKSDLSQMASLIVEGVDDGYADAIDTLIMAKKGLYVFESIVEGLKGKVVLPQTKDYQKHNCVMREQMTGVKYDFTVCGDPVYDQLAAQLFDMQQKIKAREAWLKGFSKPTEVEQQVDEETGDILVYEGKINPPVKTGGHSIILSIK